MMTKINKFLCALCALCAVGFVACSEDDIPDNFYSSTKVTAAGFIKADDAQFSDFRTILTRANYLSMLDTYGTYTVFVPTNDAVSRYLADNGYASVADLSVEQCDTLARTHIVKTQALFTTDIDNSSMPMNMNDRYLELSTDSDVMNNNALIVYVNKNARIIQKDDSVTNGVVHVVDHMLTASNQFLPDLMEEDPQLTIFCQALRLTGMADSISRYLDETYTCGDDSVTKGVKVKYSTAADGSANLLTAYFPEKRYFKYTAFVETDSIFRLHGINDLDDLKAYAKQVYDESYPEDAGLYDNDWHNRKNPLNRFISYHLINRIGLYEDWVVLGAILEKCHIINVADPEDYYETMCPHSIMRFCYASDQLYINRKGLARNAQVRGVRVMKRGENGKDQQQQAVNGIYHYIDDILTYSAQTRNNVLNRRMRIDGTTLSPDFMNSNARVHWMEQNHLTGFKNDYVTDWKMSDETFVGVHSEQTSWWSYEGNAICVSGIYDVSMKLPPIPFSGTWEIRMGYSLGNDRGAAQVYLNNVPCGVPVDFRLTNGDYTGWEADTEDEEENMALDKAMRNRGYMKCMDSYGGDNPFRARFMVRRILTKQYLDVDETYWLRFRQVLDDDNLYMSFDYLELCPKSVYDSPEGEDRH